MAQPYDPARFREFEHAGWERVGAGYDDSFGLVTRQSAGPLLDVVGLPAAGARAGMRLLDIACGPGYVTAAAAARGAFAVGLDFAASVVSAAQRRHTQAAPGSIEFRQGDAEALLFPDASFDAVVCSFGVPHFPHPERALAEAFRVLKRGGRYALTDWTPAIPASLNGLFLAAVQRHGDPHVPVPQGPPRGQFADPPFCARLFAGAGFAPPHLQALDLVLTGTPPEGVTDIILRGMVRTRGVFELQTPQAQAAIRADIAAAALAYVRDGEARLPCPATLVWAEKR